MTSSGMKSCWKTGAASLPPRQRRNHSNAANSAPSTSAATSSRRTSAPRIRPRVAYAHRAPPLSDRAGSRAGRPTDDDTTDAPRLRPGRLAARGPHLPAAPARSPWTGRAARRGAGALGGGPVERPVGDAHPRARGLRLVSLRAAAPDRGRHRRGARNRLPRPAAARARGARPGPRRAGAGRHRGGRAVALRDAGGVRPRRQGSRRLRQRRRADRATRRAAGARSGRRLGARRVPRARDPLAQHAELLQLAVHGLLRHRSRGGHDPRPVPALPARLDRHRLRPRRAHRRAPRHALLGAARPGQRLHPGRAAVRPDGGRGGHRPARHQRDRGLVQRLPERRGRRPDAAVRGDAGVVAGPGRRARVLRRGRGVPARHAAVPARRHGHRRRRLRRRRGHRPHGRPAGRSSASFRRSSSGSPRPASTCSA